jgi:hypothetical protein
MKRHLLIFVLLVFLLGSGCSGEPEPTPDVEATVAAAVAATQTAAPTATPTETPVPTDTPIPTQTPTPIPTDTPIPSPSEAPQPDGGETATSTLDSGWILYEVTTESFAIALPPTWEQLDLSAAGMEDTLAVMGERNPEFGQFFSSQYLRGLLAAGIKFYGLDMSEESFANGFPTSVNVIKLDLGLDMPLDLFVNVNLQQVESLANPDYPVTHERIQIGDMEAEEFSYQAQITDPLGDSIDMWLNQYLLLDGPVAYVITLGGVPETEQTQAQTFHDIAQSFRLLPE